MVWLMGKKESWCNNDTNVDGQETFTWKTKVTTKILHSIFFHRKYNTLQDKTSEKHQW